MQMMIDEQLLVHIGMRLEQTSQGRDTRFTCTYELHPHFFGPYYSYWQLPPGLFTVPAQEHTGMYHAV